MINIFNLIFKNYYINYLYNNYHKNKYLHLQKVEKKTIILLYI